MTNGRGERYVGHVTLLIHDTNAFCYNLDIQAARLAEVLIVFGPDRPRPLPSFTWLLKHGKSPLRTRHHQVTVQYLSCTQRCVHTVLLACRLGPLRCILFCARCQLLPEFLKSWVSLYTLPDTDIKHSLPHIRGAFVLSRCFLAVTLLYMYLS